MAGDPSPVPFPETGGSCVCTGVDSCPACPHTWQEAPLEKMGTWLSRSGFLLEELGCSLHCWLLFIIDIPLWTNLHLSRSCLLGRTGIPSQKGYHLTCIHFKFAPEFVNGLEDLRPPGLEYIFRGVPNKTQGALDDC